MAALNSEHTRKIRNECLCQRIEKQKMWKTKKLNRN